MRKKFSFGLLFLLLAVAWSGCNPPAETVETVVEILPRATLPDYAAGFSFSDMDSLILVSVKRTQRLETPPVEYLLRRQPCLIPEKWSHLSVIDIPLKKVVLLSTTYLAPIKALEMADRVIGFQGTRFIYDPDYQKRVKAGNINEVGTEQTLDLETIVTLQPDVVFAYHISESANPSLERLQSLGIPVVLNGDYLENEPLGMAEWIKFFALFFDRQSLADSLFQLIANDYQSWKERMEKVSFRPCVFLNAPWREQWAVPSGESYSAVLLRDAGGDYVWSNSTGTGSLFFDFEMVFSLANNCDFWLNPGSASTLNALKTQEDRFSRFKAFAAGNVYNKNERSNNQGANDYWESGSLYPNRILKDLIAIFHPDSLPVHEFVYYRKLPEK